MTQGTKSFLFGCHQFLLHPYFIIKAWKWWYGRYPYWKEIVCILIHDIGICGRQYLDGDNKKGHWQRGALLAYRLFGDGYMRLCTGHTDESGFIRSMLFIPDKISYLFCPVIWLKWCTFLERFNERSSISALQWRRMVRENMLKGFPLDNHQIYLNNRRN